METATREGLPRAPGTTSQADWGHPRVPWTFNLRLTEPHKNKLEFILANRREKSTHQMLAKIIDGFIESELERLQEAGIAPDSSQD